MSTRHESIHCEEGHVTVGNICCLLFLRVTYCFARIMSLEPENWHGYNLFLFESEIRTGRYSSLSIRAAFDSQTHDEYVFEIVYSLCGGNRKEELLRSIQSLLLLITATGETDRSIQLHALYRIHIITDGSITTEDLPEVQPTKVCYRFHKPNSKAATLFAPCSTQRLYLHEHPGFSDAHEVGFSGLPMLI